jgi:hypothetical protein
VPNRGTVGPAALAAIKYFRAAHARCDPFRGVHRCEICGQATSHGEFFIDLNGVRYILPNMVVHYVEAHGYAPPAEFLEQLEAFWAIEGQELVAADPSGACILSMEEAYLRRA